MSEFIPPDVHVREKIKEELTKNFLVEAGAGSGKTSSLVGRMVSLVSNGKFRVEEIAAITFTRKAAAELKERFQAELEKSCLAAQDEKERNNLETALNNIDRAFVGTIHSFCARLLRERPVEAGIDPDFKEMDDLQEKILIKSAWDNFLQDVRLKEPHYLERLNELDIATSDLEGCFYNLSAFPDVEVHYERVPKPDLGEALESVRSLVERASGAIPATEPEKGYDKLQEAVLSTVRKLKYFDLSKDKNIIRILSAFDRELNVTLYKWKSKDEAKQFRDEFKGLAAEIVGPVMKGWREYCHYYVMEFLIRAVKYYQNMRYNLSYLNFQDLLLKTAALLRNNPEVRRYFQKRYRSLLLDEFQDTDPIQAEIMFYLTGQDATERDWMKLQPGPGSLFVVGDPKQSIYRFRRADIDTYNLVKGLIQKTGGEVLKLTANFRSVQKLGNWFNPVFEKLLPEKNTRYQAGYSPLETVNRGEDGPEGVRVLEIPASYRKKQEIIEAEAHYIARYIKQALNNNYSPRDFMILLRYKDGMDLYARTLENYGIPVTMAGGSSLKDCREINELVKLLRFLQDTENQVFLVAVLRGIFFGINDEKLYRFKRAGGSFNIFAPVPPDLTEETAGVFSDSFGRLKKYYRWRVDHTPAVALEKIIADLGIVPYLLSQPLGKSRCSYIYQILELIRKKEAEGKTRFDEMVEVLDSILAADIEEEISITGGDEDAVRLMNLHKAKGLEAPVVFLAHPCKSVSCTAERFISRSGRKSTGYFAAGKRNYGNFKPFALPREWEKYEEEELKYLAAEEMRLLYVAATRAKRMLIISKSLKDMKKNPWAPLLEESPEEPETLEVPEVDFEKKGDEKGETTEDYLNKIREDLKEWQKIISVPTYRLDSPTKHKDSSRYQVKRISGGGTALGNVIHKGLEEAVKGNPELETVIEIALKENDLPLRKRDEVLGYIEEFRRTELWRRLKKAERKLTEVPFSLKLEKGHELYERFGTEKGVSVFLSGVIDLAFKETEGWVIVDYKSDRVLDKDGLAKLLEVYSEQVKVYCKVWEEISGESVIAAGVYFTYLNCFYSLPIEG